MGGKARAESLTAQEHREHALVMVAARMVKITPLKRSRIASQAGKIGNAVRWAGHVVPDYNEYRREWRRNRSNVELTGAARHGQQPKPQEVEK